jgi:large subunit ribosomal protein L17
MRHRKNGRTLGRKRDPRKALLRGLATNFLLYEKIQTTEAKAKEIRPIVEKLITTGKKNDLNARRKLLAYLYTENAVKKVIDEISPRYQERNGGYTRIVKIGPRKGDGAPMVVLELV